ncbi:FAD/NAD(P)-binding domain-containing protein [Xylariaceae sp. AK1471]|nr:FAD/NAD(P)-binding domain-containing protein [Xylariaceae sp. AK1471]
MDPLPEDAIHSERQVKIICIGAGASGLCLAYKIRRSFRNFDLTIYDKNPTISGTWHENRYPGCACDVPSHNYTYSFEPKADWTSVYAGSLEIKGYFESFAKKYDLWTHIKTSHLVSETRWVEDEGHWQVTVKNTTSGEIISDWCHILVHATGGLSQPEWPNVPGINKYKGIKVHSADYDESLSLQGKDVILVGAGSSAVQILPAIQPLVKRVKIIVRSPTWVLPDIGSKNRPYTPEEIAQFTQEPHSLLTLRQVNEQTMNSIFTMYMKGTTLQSQSKSLLTAVIRDILKDEVMEKNLTPKFSVGCKRVIPSGYSYLNALKEDNVDVIYSGMASFTEQGCTTEDGQSHSSDIIICATGFDTSFVPRYPVLANGRNLQNMWAREILTGYLGIGIPGFPNTFTIGGPYSPVTNGAQLIGIEAQTDYICAFIDRFQTEPTIRSMSVKRDVCDEFTRHVASNMQSLVWTDDCRSSNNKYHKQVPTTWPGSTLHYLEAIREPRFEDWEFGYAGNRFAWLGDGLSQVEWDPTADLAYYIREADDSAPASRRARNLAIGKTGSLSPRVLHCLTKLVVPGSPETVRGEKGIETVRVTKIAGVEAEQQ